VTHRFITPVKPSQNGYIESFSGKRCSIWRSREKSFAGAATEAAESRLQQPAANYCHR
jgi:hypothetical protein